MNHGMTIAGVIVILGVCYLVACLLFPFAACTLCKGDGRKRSGSGKAWRRCRRCKGTGERLRVGARIWSRYRR